MKNITISILLISFLACFVVAASVDTGLGAQVSVGAEVSLGNSTQVQTQTQLNSSGKISEYQAKVVKREQNELKVHATAGNCPSDCECSGSTTKCELGEGREMTIQAGNSGNTIIQMKGINTSTNVSLYKSEGKYYGEFNGETKQVNYLPDEAGEKLRLHLNQSTQTKYEMNLTQEGEYEVQSRNQVKVLGLFNAEQKIQAKVNAFNGEISETKNPWWSFLITSEVEADVE